MASAARMISQNALGVVIVAFLGFATVLVANRLRDHGVAVGVSRRVAGSIGGLAFLVAIITLDASVAVILMLSIAAGIALLRWFACSHVRGLRQKSGNRWGEVAYALAGAVSLLVGWKLLGDRWLGFVPISFMAWGDNVAGITREYARSSRGMGAWPSVAMLATCLLLAFLYKPYWIAAAGALAAVIVERFRPTPHPIWDDNWAIVGAALAVMIVLRRYALA